MPTRFLNRYVLMALLSVAAAVAIVIAPMSVRPAYAAAPTLLASASCHGDLGKATDPGDLPGGDMSMSLTFFDSNSAHQKFVNPAKKSGSIGGLFTLSVNNQCTSNAPGLPNSTETPCFLLGSFTGAMGSPNVAGSNMSIAFADSPPASGGGQSAGPDILDGCSMAFAFMPYSKGSSAAFIATGAVTGTCKPNGTRMLLTCTLNNE